MVMEQKPEDGAPPKKEAAVLSDSSLEALGSELAASSLKLCMYLNVPTTTLINIKLKCQAKGQSEEETGGMMLLQWKSQRALAKEKEKAAELERALRDIGSEIADVVAEKHRENQELTKDMFPH